MFFFSPALLMQGSIAEIIQVTVTGAIGVWFLAGSTEGWFGGKLAMPLRVVLFAAAIAVIVPETTSDIVGLIVGFAIYSLQRVRFRKATA
jgi:TRAP-type uncharacterized transport system fused permease subunit